VCGRRGAACVCVAGGGRGGSAVCAHVC
jgi:hypothetical protein